MSRIGWLGLGALFATLLLISGRVSAQDESTEPQSPDDFRGKIVMIIVDRSNALESRRSTEVLKDARIRKMGERFFIVGEAFARPKSEDKWRDGAEVGIAWDIVQQYYVYSPEKFDDMVKNWPSDEEE